MTNPWSVDAEIAADITEVFGLIARCSTYPDSLGYEEHFRAIVCQRRPA